MLKIAINNFNIQQLNKSQSILSIHFDGNLWKRQKEE